MEGNENESIERKPSLGWVARHARSILCTFTALLCFSHLKNPSMEQREKENKCLND